MLFRSDMNNLPDEIDDLRYCVLDYSDPANADYHWVPLVFLESFSAPAAVLKIGDNTIQMPLDWSIIIGEPELGEPEVVPIMSVNDRGFKAFQFNPLSSFRPEFYDIDIINVYPDVKWYFPKLKPGQMLAVPITDGDNPLCAYFVKDISRQSEVVDYGKIW